jgi:heme exporter protein C
MRRDLAVGALGLILLAIGQGIGLFVAPAERMMGDVGRILYVHVPTAWVCLVMYTVAFGAAIVALIKGTKGADAWVEASVEVGLLLNVLLLIQGSIWARPTWGVWWTWDARLTTAAVMVVAFAAVLVLREIIDSPSKRLTVSAVATILAYVDVPIVYMSVKWWRTLHQPFSSPETVSSSMVTPLRISAFGMLFLGLGFAMFRKRLALRRLEAEDAETALPPLPAPLDLGGEKRA